MAAVRAAGGLGRAGAGVASSSLRLQYAAVRRGAAVRRIVPRWSAGGDATSRPATLQVRLQTRALSGGGSEHGDLIVKGAGNVSGGGRWRNVEIGGAAAVDGNVTCERMDARGALRVSGGITTVDGGPVKSSGGLKCAGKVDCGTFTVNGSADVGSVKAEQVNVAGSLNVREGIECRYLEGKGGIAAKKDIVCETFRLDAATGGRDVARTIAAKRAVSIIAQRAEWYVSMFIPHTRDMTRVGTITGSVDTDSFDPVEVVVLENVRAKLVRGRTIQIKGKCRIDRVEFVETCDIDRDSEVRELYQAAPTPKTTKK